MFARLCRAAIVGAALLAAGCATIPPDAGNNAADPLEVYNRHVYEFNERADQYVIRPLAEGYVKVVPQSARDCIGNIFRNLGDLGNAVNNLLQGKAFEAGSDICRVAINSTVGLLGCFDVATRVGLTRGNEDFGQTLGRWGVGPGAYFVLPLLGPSSIRDTAGRVADVYTDPLSYVDSTAGAVAGQSLRVIDLRASLLDASKLLEGAALDKYQFVRDAYLQRRRNLVYDGDPPRVKEPEEEEPVEPEPPAGKPEAPAEPDAAKPPVTPDQPAPAPAR
jgi:phospholipid-binding lipoprotein MlaA